MSVNARGTFLGCKYAIAQMKQGLHPSGDRGWIINCPVLLGWAGWFWGLSCAYPFLHSSLHISLAELIMVNLAAYCSSKSAIAQLTKQVAVDYGKHKIHINAICPGGNYSIFHLPSSIFPI
jgi:NAD(P)-dependent dehydrogenase (short-subunit alcohol dehydrogenase family)